MLVGLVGCAPTKPSNIVSTSTDIFRSIRESRAELKSLRVEAKAEVRSGVRRTRFHAAMLVSSPDQFFLEAGGFGISASLVSASKDLLQIFIPAKSQFFSGSPVDGFRSLLGLDLTTKEWVSILLGDVVPEIPDELGLTKQSGNWMSIEARLGNQWYEYIIDVRTGWLKSVERKGGTFLKVEFGDPLQTSAGSYPSTLKAKSAHGTLVLEFQNVEPNASISASQFRFDVPKTISPKPIESAGTLIGS